MIKGMSVKQPPIPLKQLKRCTEETFSINAIRKNKFQCPAELNKGQVKYLSLNPRLIVKHKFNVEFSAKAAW